VRTLAEAYRHAGDVAATTSTLHARVAAAVSGSDEALAAISALPARGRQPAQVLAAVHDLALAGRAPALAEAYARGDADAAATAAIGTLLRSTDDVAAVAARRRTQTVDTAGCAVLYPAVGEAARRAGAGAVGLVDVGGSVGLNLHVDRVGIGYDDGRTLGDPSSPVQLTASVVGGRPVPTGSVPEVVARIGVGPDPVDVTDSDDVRWLRACVPPDRLEDAARLSRELGLAASAPPVVLRGDAVDLLADAVAQVPGGALPVVTTTWALSALRPARRQQFLDRLVAAADGRSVAWVSVEGVGVAPSVPTFGDRPASGHSIIGVTVLDGSALRAEAVGRCWSRGRLLSWLADS
jgi:hypothetical protein